MKVDAVSPKLLSKIHLHVSTVSEQASYTVNFTNVLKISNTFLFQNSNKMYSFQELLARITNRENPVQTASSVCAVCLCLFSKRPVFAFLEHLLYV